LAAIQVLRRPAPKLEEIKNKTAVAAKVPATIFVASRSVSVIAPEFRISAFTAPTASPAAMTPSAIGGPTR
jgi:hypothetical protein